MSLQPTDLPDTLRERTRVLRGDGLDGDFVLYWVRGAIRGWENPALDVAIEAANRLGKPLFVHQALSERYPFASDRHHTFILEGARDLARDLDQRGIGAAFHLERPGHRGAVTKQLAERAALVVLEDLPTHPLRDWAERLARDVDTRVWAVDAACVVPMTLLKKSYTRAFRFRDAIAEALEARVRLPWVDATYDGAPFVPELPYQPVDLAGDLAELVASCAVDHTVGPVLDTRGGSTAGYARWDAFVQGGGLKRYAWTRNKAEQDGVSRMSAYLHHGMVAPTRIARETAEHGGKSADKYLDELVIWRELAWNFCRFHADHDTLAALPGWALETLRRHAEDPRPERIGRERLWRARSGSPLWDACQRSLLIHGELHNNVRMTWGKALLQWTAGPEEALDALVDLNHRYALDGRDPASFGGLLWCMGQFDRPFSPEQPILGTVRPRELDGHAARLDLEAYAGRVGRPRGARRERVAVVGAGPAGALCARTLHDHGLEVTLFDKGRGAGGRLSTRRADARRFDHGGSILEEVAGPLGRYARAWVEAGVLAPWEAPFIEVAGGEARGRVGGKRYVPAPAANALLKHLLADLDVRFGARVVALRRDGDPVVVVLEDGAEHAFDRVVVAVPAPQAVPLLEGVSPALGARMDAVRYAPQWVLMAGIPVDSGKRWGGARFVEDPVLDVVIRNQTRPGRPPGEQWVVQASPAWSREHLEASAEDVARLLWDELRARTDVPDADHLAAHRWRFSRVEQPVGEPCLVSADSRIGVCGDGVSGGGIGEALGSGAALAGRVLALG